MSIEFQKELDARDGVQCVICAEPATRKIGRADCCDSKECETAIEEDR